MNNKGWFILVIAGFFEIAWAVCMDQSKGFTVWYYDVLFAIALVASTFMLARSLREGIPVGTAYAVWTGIGAVGTIVITSMIDHSLPGPRSMLFVVMIICGIIGLQLTSGSDPKA